MTLIEEVKLKLRTKASAYDTDIQDLIDACKADLKIGGIRNVEETEPLTKQAIKLYCLANFGYDENSEKFALAYEKLKQSMALCGDYNEVVTSDV